MKRFYVGLFAVLLSVHAASAQSLQRSAASPDKDKASVMRTGRLPRASGPRLYGVTGFTAPSGGRPVKAAAMPQEMITQQPEGTLHKDMYRNSGGYWSFFGNYMFENTFGFTQDVVVNDGGDVYVKDPFSLFVTGTWMKGTDGGDGKVTFSLPQKIYEETDPSTGKKYSYYVQKLVEVTMTDEYGYEYIGYEVDGSDNSVTFEYENDTIRKTGGALLGLTDENGRWMGYGDTEIKIFRLGETPVMPADPDAAETYSVEYPVSDSETGISIVKVINDGTDVYVCGLSGGVPGGWVKGTMKDGKAVFAQQYIGVDPEEMTHMFFMPAKADSTYYSDWDMWDVAYTPCESVAFSFDADGRTFSTDEAFVISAGREEVYAFDCYNWSVFKPWREIAVTPADPEMVGWMPYESYYGYGGFKFNVKRTGVDGTPLDTKQLYYMIFLDGSPLVFTTDVYVNFPYDMIEVPYSFDDDYDIESEGDLKTVYYYDPDFTIVGLQSVYRGGGETRMSNVVYYDTSAGIGGVEDFCGEPVSVTYTDLAGRRVSAPSAGIYIRTSVYADGRVKSSKVIVR